MEEEVLGKAYDSRLMRRLLTYLWPYRGYVGLSLLFLLAHSLLQVAGPLLTKIAVDKYLAPNPNRQAAWLESWLAADPG
ncbi:MAG: ABC transporter ATP-binding protein, partial [Acidobacteria bacterium]|nr:ABC transporter ATP-binding protein [Acidobacteriota bacterium]